MMGFTHIAIGLSASLLITQPHTVDSLLTAVIGGAIGSIASDLDVKPTKFSRDAVYAREVMGMLVMFSLLASWKLHSGIWERLLGHNLITLICGLAICIACLVFAVLSKHRSFAHSLTAMALSAAGIALIDLNLLLPYIIGFMSHLILDLLNKAKIPLLYPMKWSFCLNLCGADGTVNKVLLWCGAAALLGTCFFLNIQ